MSLVSKSRERLLMMDQHQMSPYFSRSREKLYGLRSLSKSHEVLDLCKTAAVSGGQNQEGVGLGILKTLTRATTADLSMIPLLRQRLLGHGSSTTSITSSVTTDQDLDEPIVPPSPSEQTTFMRMQSTPSSVVQSPVPPSPVEQTKYIRMPSNPNSAVQSPVSSTTIEELLENSTEETTSRTKPEPITQIPALLSPKLLKETLQNNSKFGIFSDSGNITENVTHANEVLMEMPESLREEIIESESCSEMDLTNGEIVTVITDCTSSNETLTLESYEQEKENVELQSKETEDIAEQIEENKSINYENSLNIESDDKNKTNTTEEECDTVEQKINGILGKKDNDGESSPEELEPRYTVAQLVSAFNRHQEVVTKTSLEVTMTTNDKDTKMAPIILESEKSKFPIGPNALRLFIPDIDITNEPPKRKQKRKYNLGIRYPNQSNENDDVPKETAETLKEMYHTEDEESFQSLESTSSLTGDCDSLTNLSIPEDPSFIEGENEEQNTIEEKKDDKNISKDEHLDVNADSTNNNDSKVENNGICTLIIDPPVVEKVQNTENEDGQEIENKLQLPVEVIPSYLRSGSLSSEASVASSETSSTMSWDELTPPNTGTPTSIKDESQQWPLKSSSTLNPIPKQISRSRSPSTNREPWGRLCSGTYNRALEKFNSKVNKQDNNGMSMDTNRRPNRKSLTLLSPPPVINPSEKVRRKSIPVIKQYS
ncbi:hypothetical protein C0J52_27996 [Blattella germanica]|nr:hypothetical protein C0J52_27996 [Blattella germanica]